MYCTLRESSCWTALSTSSLGALAVFSWRTASPWATMLENRSLAEVGACDVTGAGAEAEAEAAFLGAAGYNERK